MDKHLHKNIGEQFSEEINKLSQQPREHIWDAIDKQLDKTEATNYKEKFTRLRKRTLLLLLLLIGITTSSIIYFTTAKNKTNIAIALNKKNTDRIASDIILAENKTSEGSTFNKQVELFENSIKAKESISLYAVKKENKSISDKEDLFSDKKINYTTKGKTNVKITNAISTEDENIIDIEATTVDKNEDKKNKDSTITSLLTPINSEVSSSKQLQSLKKDSSIAKENNLATDTKNKKQQQKKSKFTLTAFAAPDFSAYRLENDELSSYDNKNRIAKREQSDISPTVGVLIGYNLSKKVTLQSGFTYSSSNISIDPSKIYAEKDNTGTVKYRYNTSFGYGYLLPSFNNTPAVGDSLFANGANHTLNYISIPIIAKYSIGHKKITFHPGIGITFNFLTKATLTTDVENSFNREKEYISKLQSIKKSGISLLITPELQYKLSKKWSISTMPYFKYSLGAVNKGNVVKTYPYTFGLGIGGVYKF
jgi:hypothetical protein